MFHQLIAFLAVAVVGANALTHIIAVGANKTLTFFPSSLTAAVGDSLEFHFYNGTGAHSVVSSTFNTPCEPAPDAFFSGYVTGDTVGTPTFTITLSSTDPIWFYCSLGKHCPLGMAGVVNPPQGETVAQYVAAAQNQTVIAPSSVTGGVLATGGATTTLGTSTSVSSVSGVGVAPTMPSTSSSGNGTLTTRTSTLTTSATGSSSSGGVAATTTPSAAGRSQDVSVMLGLIPVIGGLVALMA